MSGEDKVKEKMERFFGKKTEEPEEREEKLGKELAIEEIEESKEERVEEEKLEEELALEEIEESKEEESRVEIGRYTEELTKVLEEEEKIEEREEEIEEILQKLENEMEGIRGRLDVLLGIKKKSAIALSKKAQKVAQILGSHPGRVSISRIEEKTGLSKEEIKEAVKELKSK